MYNKELLEKICNVTCSFEELELFQIKIDKKEFDLEKPFEKYYDLDKILFAISRYENKEVNDKYLAYWMCMYNWLIMGYFEPVTKDNPVTFKKWLEWEISDWLDSLSFFDDSDDWYNLEDYKNTFKILDKIYNNLQDWNGCFAHTDEWGDNDDDIVVLAYNEKINEFVKMYGELDYLHLDVKFERVELDELEKQIEKLRKNGYQELKYGTWDED